MTCWEIRGDVVARAHPMPKKVVTVDPVRTTG
jgi:hypothetical protein